MASEQQTRITWLGHATVLIQTAKGTNIQNAPRHSENCAHRPPKAGPSRVATPHIADTNAIARGHNSSARARRTTE